MKKNKYNLIKKLMKIGKIRFENLILEKISFGIKGRHAKKFSNGSNVTNGTFSETRRLINENSCLGRNQIARYRIYY